MFRVFPPPLVAVLVVLCFARVESGSWMKEGQKRQQAFSAVAAPSPHANEEMPLVRYATFYIAAAERCMSHPYGMAESVSTFVVRELGGVPGRIP